jgi:hypothetical protein
MYPLKSLILTTVFLVSAKIVFCQVEQKTPLYRNQLGIDASLGYSYAYHNNGKLSYAANLNYTRISKNEKWNFAFGVRFTQLNVVSDKIIANYSLKTDTFKIVTQNILFFDTPINFRRNFSINTKTSFFLNFGWFFTTYIKVIKRTDKYVMIKDEAQRIDRNVQFAQQNNYFKMGVEFGVGFSHKISPKSLIFIYANPLNMRIETRWEGKGYHFPNLTVGYRFGF